ncbi:MAG: beta-ketoacyl-[acyl-carrier-protein] synthase family protein [Endomicrobia bacterium]|nr:beta-ketoacyl-[acyl-carrier-protein] synthase family protein [Endomicrobiia bacterium]
MNDIAKIKFAVTGIGLVTPLGTGKEINWHRLLNSESAVRYEISNEAFIARVSGFDFDEKLRQLGMAFIAANEALAEANIKDSGYRPDRIGLACGESKQNIFIKNFSLENEFPQQLQKVLNIQGAVHSVSAACATGALNIIQGCRMIEDDICDAVICGSSETTIHPLYISAFKNMGVLSKQGVRPFDKDRDGFAVGEGSGFIVVENIKKAVLRGAKIYCEISGFSNGVFSDNAFSVNSPFGMERIIKQAVKNEIPDYIHMHGTGTKINDFYESEAVKRQLQITNYELRMNDKENINSSLPLVSSTKGSTGHLLGVSGIAGAVFSILAMKDNIVPPTINFKETDIPFGLNYAPNKPQKKTVLSALSLSFGFGGQGAALYFKKPWGSSIYA